MTNQLITLDWQSDIQIDPARPPLKNFQVLGQTLSGLKLLADSANQSNIKDVCTNYASQAAPDVHKWRNKVAAHSAATDPKKNDDSLATLKLTVMDPITYNDPYFYVGSLQLHSQGTDSDLPEWSLTKNFEGLASRFWPDIQLKPFSR